MLSVCKRVVNRLLTVIYYLFLTGNNTNFTTLLLLYMGVEALLNYLAMEDRRYS